MSNINVQTQHTTAKINRFVISDANNSHAAYAVSQQKEAKQTKYTDIARS